MGRDGLLPPMFAKVNPCTMTPVNNTVIVAVIISILAGVVPLDYLADMVSIGTLVAFIVVSVGVIILRVREPDLPRGFKVPSAPSRPSYRSWPAATFCSACTGTPGWPSAAGSCSPGVLLRLGPPPQRTQRPLRARLVRIPARQSCARGCEL